MKTTDIKSVKETALAFLYLDIEETNLSPIIVMHPIFESAFVHLPKSNRMCDILEDESGREEIIQFYKERIENAKTLSNIYCIIIKSYRLTFLKYVEEYLSNDDFSEFLADAWVSSENPNQDANVSVKQLARMFRKSNKKILMDDEEYKVYENLPEEFIVYRGVARNRNPHGMSWTKNLETAEWFAHRFDIGNKTGYVQQAIARKENVLAYFDGRNEDEIVIHIDDLKDIKRME